jgi:tetratricopeptide (TPR) repeat protein
MRGGARAFSALVALSLLVSCQSGPSDRISSSPQEQDIARLDSVELRLLDLRISPDPAGLSALRSELDTTAARLSTSRLLSARVAGLQAQAALQAGDLPAARRYADSAAGLSSAEDGAWLVKAALEQDPAKRLAILDQGLARADRKPRLLCERGEALLQQGRYAEAAQDLDEGLRGLDDRYRALYGPDRDKALTLAQAVKAANPAAPPLSADALQATLTMGGMVERAFSGTHLLGALSSKTDPSFDDLRQAVTAAGMLLEPDAPANAPAARKDVAFFLWGIVLRAERNPRLAGMYRRKYPTSPVPDVPADAPWFEATLGVVEREIMDLPDGIHFQPDGAVTGVEYLQMLNRLQRLYP